ncbi:MAG: DEAD/DEAH box helicase, partial [Acidimicrobiales bacterium]
MSLQSLPALLRHHPLVPGLIGTSSAVIAVPEPARAFFVAGLAHLLDRQPIVVAVPTTAEAERVAHDLRAYLGQPGGPGGGGADATSPVEVFPAWETLPFERVSPSVETMGRRLRVLWRLRQPDRAPRVLVAPIRALVQRLGPHVEEVEPVVVRPGDQIDPIQLVERLVLAGYRREYQVEHRGEVARRGSIVDVFPSTADRPVRIDLWGDEVDRLCRFSVSDQRSTSDVPAIELFPCRELLPTDEVRERAAALVGSEPWGREQWERLAEGATFEGMESWLPWLGGEQSEHVLFDLVGPGGLVVLVEPRRMRDRAKELLEEEASLAGSLAQTWGASAEREWPRLHLPFDRLLAHTRAPAWTMVNAAEGPDTIAIGATGWDPVLGDAERLSRQVRDLLSRDVRVVVAADGAGSAARMSSLLGEHGALLPVLEEGGATGARSGVTAGGGAGAPAASEEGGAGAPPGRRRSRPSGIVVQPLERGFVLVDAKVAVLTEGDITGRRRAHRRPRPRRTDAQGFFEDLQPGDYVVHHHHGVAKYGGMAKRAIGGSERDYLLLEYRGGDKLYVPSDQIDAVRHYTGGDTPSLNRLGGGDWQKTRARVKSAVREIAQELVVLYRRRMASAGHAFPPDTPWQRELEEAFPYQETPDQLKAITEVKADMEEPVPMDRLVCGDVGFGKTEVAIRAAFKAVQDGKQVAVLVPTTLLAQQHLQTFSERMRSFPVTVRGLSRFTDPAEATKVLAGLADGTVDIVIGTHRLLQGGVRWKDLGLVVVDEEQRFGVEHKEHIKALRTAVDVLTMSATPIPRTLEMSLAGIREMSTILTPPEERHPVLTYVGAYDDKQVGAAIRRELLRDGQVFYVH